MNAAGALPPLTELRHHGAHRLIPSKYTADLASVLTRIAGDDRHLQDLFDLDQATNERMAAENGLLPGIGAHELVFGIPNFRVVNAAFSHAHPLGSRFNGPDRGAWYAAFALKTAQVEVAFHKTIEYAEIGRFEDSVTYDDYLADFRGAYHDIRSVPDTARVMNPDSYRDSQAFAGKLLDAGSLGVIYPSVRHPNGKCLACFRPALVTNVRKAKRYRFTWSGKPGPRITSD